MGPNSARIIGGLGIFIRTFAKKWTRSLRPDSFLISGIHINTKLGVSEHSYTSFSQTKCAESIFGNLFHQVDDVLIMGLLKGLTSTDFVARNAGSWFLFEVKKFGLKLSFIFPAKFFLLPYFAGSLKCPGHFWWISTRRHGDACACWM